MPKTHLALCLSFSLFAACAPPAPSEFDQRSDESWDEASCGVVAPPPPKILARPPKCPTAPAKQQAEAKQPAAVPQATEGHLDQEIIRSVIRRAMSSVQSCYERALLENPAAEGRVVVDFTIGPSGGVIEYNVRPSDMEDVPRCVSAVIKRLKFPAPEGGGVVQVSYPFVFSNEHP